MHTSLILSFADPLPWVVYQPVTAGNSKHQHHQQATAAADDNRKKAPAADDNRKQAPAADDNRRRQQALGVAYHCGNGGQRHLALFS